MAKWKTSYHYLHVKLSIVYIKRKEHGAIRYENVDKLIGKQQYMCISCTNAARTEGRKLINVYY